jgi:RHS repeat-associated protein
LGPLWWPEPAAGRIFSELGKLLAQEDAFGRIRRWTYDASGNVRTYIDFDGSKWTYEMGAWHFLCATTSPLDATVQFTHTTAGNVASCVDAGGTRSEYGYDLRDQLVSVQRHGKVRETYALDAAGNLLIKYAGDGRELLRFEMGPGNLPIKRALSSGDEHTFDYDADGHKLLAATRRDSLAFAYDTLHNCVSEKRNGLGVERTFADFRRPSELVVFGRFSIRYEYADAHQIVITDPGGKSHQIRFSPHGIVERHCAQGSHELAQFDPAGRCLFRVVQHADQRSWNRRYHWSGEGELRLVEDDVFGEVRHEYDAAHRLSRRFIAGRTEVYAMDSADNLVAQPGLEHVTLQSGNRLQSVNQLGFVYNDRDHVESRETPHGVVRYLYDSRDQLVKIEMPQGTLELEYDALGRRTRKIWGGTASEYYWSDDQLLAEVWPDGGIRIYIYADALALTPMMFLDFDSIETAAAAGRRYFVFCDQVGAPCLIEDETGTPVWRANIAPFGAAEIARDASIEFNLRFPGHYWDRETGLHYNRFRYFDPVLGRYLQSDPWGVIGGVNLYAYLANPLERADVRGHGEEDGTSQKPKEDQESTPPATKAKQSDNPLEHMGPDALQQHCKARADELAGQMKPGDQRGVTIGVTVVQEKGAPATRRVVVTSSTNDGKLPPGVGPLHAHETNPNPGPVLRERNAPKGPDGEVPKKIKITEHEGGTTTAELVPEKRLYADNPQTGEKGTEPYVKRSPENPEGSSDHHAEQRAKNSVGPNEEVAGMCASKPCCSGCRDALGDDLSKVPPERQGKP